MNKLVYIVGGDHLIEKMFEEADIGYVNSPNVADIVCFTGGEDVTPALYGADKHPTTYNNPGRDFVEQDLYNKLKPEQLKVGICRGSQFLCVMNGGTLFQDVDNHAIRGVHELTYLDEDGRVTRHMVTSTHHQMQNPYELPRHDYEIWGRAHISTYRDGPDPSRIRFKGPPAPADVEIVYYPQSHSLAFQGHPEYGYEECRELFFMCLERAMKRKP